MRETKTLEFKENVSDSFLKTVSAFANFGGGKILFGYDDNGHIVTLKNIDKSALQIENKINDSINPKPDFLIHKNYEDRTITLEIKDGIYKPYFYNNKIYKRNDTSTISVSKLEHSRMVLKSMNLNFEDLESNKQNLSFETLKKVLIPIKQIEHFNKDTLKTLNLLNDNKYNNAANLISDNNSFPGIDIVKFGDDINIFLDRKTIENCSVITEYNDTIEMFKKYFLYEKIENAKRQVKERLPLNAFREAVANAILHREYDVNAKIRIEMFDDLINITSPGGLPDGISEEDYISGKLSVLRNPKLSNIFLQLKYIEQFATGIKRIHNCYKDFAVKPSFNITESSITITLPTYDKTTPLTTNERIIFDSLNQNEQLSSSEIASKTSFSRNTCIRLLSNLVRKKLIKQVGTGRGTKYIKV